MLRLEKIYRLINSNCLLTLTTLSLALQHCPEVAFAEQLPVSVYKAAEEILDYSPDVESYQPPIRPLFRKLDSAINQRSKSSNELFRKILTESDIALTKMPRGLHDEIYFIKALSHEYLGEIDEAKSFFKKSLALRSDNSVALFRYAHLMLQDGDCSDALSMLYESAWRDKERGYRINYLIGECLLLLKRESEASAAFELSASSPTIFLPTYRRLVELNSAKLLTAKTPEQRLLTEQKISSLLETITSRDPEDQESAVNYAKILLKKNDLLIGNTILDKVESLVQNVATRSNYTNIEGVRILADMQMRKKNFEKAKATIQKGLLNNPKSQLLLEAKQQLEIEQSLQSNGS